MAYPKITVNTGKAFEILASDTIPIPSPYSVPLTGTTTNTRADGLDDSSADFSNVVVGDIVYNTSTSTLTTVTGISSSTSLDLASNIFQAAGAGENYIVWQAGPIFEKRIESSSGCLLYVGSNVAKGNMTVGDTYGDVKVKTTQGDIVTFNNFPVGEYLPLQIVQLYSTGTDTTIRNECLAIW